MIEAICDVCGARGTARKAYVQDSALRASVWILPDRWVEVTGRESKQCCSEGCAAARCAMEGAEIIEHTDLRGRVQKRERIGRA